MNEYVIKKQNHLKPVVAQEIYLLGHQRGKMHGPHVAEGLSACGFGHFDGKYRKWLIFFIFPSDWEGKWGDGGRASDWGSNAPYLKPGIVIITREGARSKLCFVYYEV